MGADPHRFVADHLPIGTSNASNDDQVFGAHRSAEYRLYVILQLARKPESERLSNHGPPIDEQHEAAIL